MKKILICGLMLFSLPSFAQYQQFRQMKAMGGVLTISPIVGLETVQKFYPNSRMETRGVYGFNMLYEFSYLAIEGEYTKSSDSETDWTTNTTYKDEEDKFRLGLRGTFKIDTYLNWYLRGGAQATNEKMTITNNTTSTSEQKDTTKIQPYIGTGLTLRLFRAISLTGSVTATYTPTDDPNLKDFEIEPVISFNVSI